MAQMQCDCGNILTMSEPVFEVVNQLTFCSVVLNSGMMQGNVCTSCGTGYIPIIQAFDGTAIKLGMTKLPKPKEKSRIVSL